MASPIIGGDDGRSSGGTPAVDFVQYRARRVRTQLLELLDALIVATEHRDVAAVLRLLDDDAAERWFPSGLREEALSIAQLPAAAFRAPMRVYRYYHQLRQLGEEAIELTHDPRQLSLDLLPASSQPSANRRAETFSATPESPRSDGGPGRRRSGSR